MDTLDTLDTYYTHYNGSRPYMVCNTTTSVTIYDTHENYLYKFDVNAIFVGISPQNEMTEFSGGYGKEYDGNSLLIHIKDHKYVFIGDKIFTFTSHAAIKEFVSPVGNNDVPYPHAIDTEGNIYLMMENKVIMNGVAILKDTSYEIYPYDYFYEHENNETEIFQEMQGFEILHINDDDVVDDVGDDVVDDVGDEGDDIGDVDYLEEDFSHRLTID